MPLVWLWMPGGNQELMQVATCAVLETCPHECRMRNQILGLDSSLLAKSALLGRGSAGPQQPSQCPRRQAHWPEESPQLWLCGTALMRELMLPIKCMHRLSRLS